MENTTDTNKSEARKASLKKFSVYLICFFIAMIGVKVIVLLGFLLSSFFQKLPLVVGIALICIYIFAIYFGVVIFRKLVSYLKNELQ